MDSYERHSIRLSRYFPKPFEYSERNVKVALDLPNYTMKGNITGVTANGAFILALKREVALLKLKKITWIYIISRLVLRI